MHCEKSEVSYRYLLPQPPTRYCRRSSIVLYSIVRASEEQGSASPLAVNQTLGEGAGRCAVPRGNPKPDGLGAVPRAHGAIRTRVEPTCYLVGLSGKAGGSR